MTSEDEALVTVGRLMRGPKWNERRKAKSRPRRRSITQPRVQRRAPPVRAGRLPDDRRDAANSRAGMCGRISASSLTVGVVMNRLTSN